MIVLGTLQVELRVEGVHFTLSFSKFSRGLGIDSSGGPSGRVRTSVFER